MLNIINKTSLNIYFKPFYNLFKLIKKEFEIKSDLILVFVDDKTIQLINKKYRKKDKPTDILSFSYKEEDFINADKFPLGEIIISVETALLNANHYNISFNLELYKLFIHGLLHILGYDHEKNTDYLEMKKKEDFLIKCFLEKEKIE